MAARPKFRKGDIVDIVMRKAVVTYVYDSGHLEITHSDQEMSSFKPDALDVETTIVGHEEPSEDPW